MSESQNEYETDAKPTPGPWEVNHDGPCPSVHAKDSSDSIAAVLLSANPSSDRDVEANARLIVVAGTAAQEAVEMGYDPVAAVEALPELLKACQKSVEGMPLASQQAQNALASAEGSGE